MKRTAAVVLLLLAACGRGAASTPSDLTPCHQLIDWCHATRLPDLTLTGNETSGALGSTDGFDLTGLLSFDQALKRDGNEDHLPQATTVQVFLGSADADTLHWGHGTNLYYAIEWGGVCVPVGGPSGITNLPSCMPARWGTVVDATTGEFVVSGT
jgi:hypothetical protein